jgi:hypothetical protein
MMKRLSLMAGMLGALAFLMATPTGAQPQAPPAAPAIPAVPAAPKAAKLYNPQAAVTLAGTVTAVNRRAAKKAGRPERVTMVLQTDQGAIKVHLGTADYLDQQALKLATGDQVEVKGVKVGHLKAPTFIAGEVRKGDQVLKLRDEATGRPLRLKGKTRPGGT